MTAYYNENDAFAVAWLRQLITDGLIAPGIVDDRSIKDVQANDLKGFDQVHFFAGIGGWSLAARLAGWPDSEKLWTGSCPCQPFSAMGQRKGINDDRHLWPEFFRLIDVCRPPIVFGEQVASKDGREWLANIFTDLETLGHAVAGADLCAAGVGAPHNRPRLYWVSYANLSGENKWTPSREQPLRDENAKVDWRKVEPCIRSMENGVRRRMERIRGAGNAIVPPLAAEFISSSREAIWS